jgi:hypothetical protein
MVTRWGLASAGPLARKHEPLPCGKITCVGCTCTIALQCAVYAACARVQRTGSARAPTPRHCIEVQQRELRETKQTSITCHRQCGGCRGQSTRCQTATAGSWGPRCSPARRQTPLRPPVGRGMVAGGWAGGCKVNGSGSPPPPPSHFRFSQHGSKGRGTEQWLQHACTHHAVAISVDVLKELQDGVQIALHACAAEVRTTRTEGG